MNTIALCVSMYFKVNKFRANQKWSGGRIWPTDYLLRIHDLGLSGTTVHYWAFLFCNINSEQIHKSI